MISRGVKISIAGGVGEMVHVLSLGPFFFFFFFYNHALFVLGTKSLMQPKLCSEKTYKSQQPPASPPHRKNQTARNHRKSPSRLAPKILIPQTRKETIPTNVQVERPKPFCRLPQTKESFAKASKRWPEGEDSHRAFL